jgi:hypothetical protein
MFRPPAEARGLEILEFLSDARGQRQGLGTREPMRWQRHWTPLQGEGPNPAGLGAMGPPRGRAGGRSRPISGSPGAELTLPTTPQTFSPNLGAREGASGSGGAWPPRLGTDGDPASRPRQPTGTLQPPPRAAALLSWDKGRARRCRAPSLQGTCLINSSSCFCTETFDFFNNASSATNQNAPGFGR